MAKVITEISGSPANDAERKAIGLLRDRLPDTWMLFHNFELRQGKEVFEIDLAIMSLRMPWQECRISSKRLARSERT